LNEHKIKLRLSFISFKILKIFFREQEENQFKIYSQLSGFKRVSLDFEEENNYGNFHFKFCYVLF
jgi:hypothetical protein